MTLSSTTTKVSYNGDGATAEFDVPFKFFQNSHVVAVLRDAAGIETTWTEGSQYSLTGAGKENGGTLTVETDPSDFTPAQGETLVIKRAMPETQGTALPLGGKFSSATVEQMVDLLTMQIQAHSEEIARAITVSAADPVTSLILPSVANRSSKIFAFDASGEIITITNFGKWRNVWAASTAYVLGDVAQRSQTGDIYVAIDTAFTSGSDEATDLTDSTRWALAMERPTVNFVSDSFTGTGAQSAFTLSEAPVSADATAAYLNGVRQEPIADYTVNGTTLTFGVAPGNGVEVLAVYGNAGAAVIADLSVTSAKVADNAVTLAKIATLTADRLIGSDGTGDPAEVSAGAGLALAGAVLSAVQASQAEIEGESNVDKYVPPDLIKHNPGVPKAWVNFDGAGALTIRSSYNVSSVIDNGLGDYTINFDVDFANNGYAVAGFANAVSFNEGTAVCTKNVGDGDLAVGSCRISTRRINGGTDCGQAIDRDVVCVSFYGDQ